MNITKFKLLKDLPKYDKGEIFHENCKYIFDTKNLVSYLTIDVLKNNPDWFAPFCFTTEDGVDIYENDTFWYIFNNLILCNKFNDQIDFNTVKKFSTRQAAEKYLLIEEAKRKYPIGIDIIPFNLNYMKDNPIKTTVTKSDYYFLNYDRKEALWVKTGQWNSVIYFEGKWAEIVEELKINDYFVYDNEVHKIDNIKISSFISNEKSYDKALCRKADNSEIISYYKNLGWVKGASFKEKGQTHVRTIELIEYDACTSILWIVGGQYSNKIEECELIKEPNYPKSWEELKEIKGSFVRPNSVISTFPFKYQTNSCNKGIFKTQKQTESALAYAQLSQLVAKMNGDWQPDWDNCSYAKFTIERLGSKLCKNQHTRDFKHLAFKTEEARDFSFQHHEKLWKQFWQI